MLATDELASGGVPGLPNADRRPARRADARAHRRRARVRVRPALSDRRRRPDRDERRGGLSCAPRSRRCRARPAARGRRAARRDGPDDAPYARLLEHLSIYLDAHWGDRAEPPPDGVGSALARDRRPARARCRASRSPSSSAAASGGSSPSSRRLPITSSAIDLQFGAVRRARRLLDGERVAYARRVIGRRYYDRARSRAGDLRVRERRRSLCGDALDPPLDPAIVRSRRRAQPARLGRHPRQLLSVIDGLCAPGGELILASPYAWQSSVMHEAERFGGADPAAALARILVDGTGLMARYAIEDEAELPWTLRRDARSTRHLSHPLPPGAERSAHGNVTPPVPYILGQRPCPLRKPR